MDKGRNRGILEHRGLLFSSRNSKSLSVQCFFSYFREQGLQEEDGTSILGPQEGEQREGRVSSTLSVTVKKKQNTLEIRKILHIIPRLNI